MIMALTRLVRVGDQDLPLWGTAPRPGPCAAAKVLLALTIELRLEPESIRGSLTVATPYPRL